MMDNAHGNSKLSVVSAFLIGILYVPLIIYALLIPAGKRYEPGQIIENYARNPLAMNIAWITMAATSILAIA